MAENFLEHISTFIECTRAQWLWFIVQCFSLAIIVTRKTSPLNKFSVPLLTAGAILSLLGAVWQSFIFYRLHGFGANDRHAIMELYTWSTFFIPAGFLTTLGLVLTILEKEEHEKINMSVWTLFFFSFFTLGIYSCYWYVKRSVQFCKAAWIPYNILMLCYSYFLYLSLYVYTDNSFEENSLLYTVFYLSVGFIYIIMAYIGVFSVSSGLEKRGGYCDPFMTFFFGPLYLQYRMNRLAEEQNQSSTKDQSH